LFLVLVSGSCRTRPTTPAGSGPELIAWALRDDSYLELDAPEFMLFNGAHLKANRWETERLDDVDDLVVLVPSADAASSSTAIGLSRFFGKGPEDSPDRGPSLGELYKQTLVEGARVFVRSSRVHPAAIAVGPGTNDPFRCWLHASDSKLVDDSPFDLTKVEREHISI
jgi:hypothetical protein